MILRIGFFVLLLLPASALVSNAQASKPATWSFAIKKTAEKEYDLVFKLHIVSDTHVYSQHIGSDGPIPTSFAFNKNQDYVLVDSVSEITKPIKVHDKMFDMDLLYFEDSAVFVQHIKVVNPVKQVSGNLVFMACDKSKCYPPSKLDFTFDIPK